jgi:hypothetical protein
MPNFCTKCGINWASLESQDDESNNETYEFCPKCKNDMFLEEVKPGQQFIMITGNIIDSLTKMPQVIQQHFSTYKEPEPFNREAWKQKQERRQNSVDDAIDAYIKACESGGQAAGEAAYFNTLQKTKE